MERVDAAIFFAKAAAKPTTKAKSSTHRPRVQPATSNAVLNTPSPGAASRGRQTDTPNPGAEETEWQFAEDEDA